MDPKFVKGSPLPASIGLCADLYHDVRTMRLAIEKVAEGVAAREKEIKDYIINNLSKSDDTGAAGKRYRAQIVTKTTPAAADWAKIHAYVAENDRFDLLQKRLSDKAIQDMWEAGEEVPGVERFNAINVSITKL